MPSEPLKPCHRCQCDAEDETVVVWNDRLERAWFVECGNCRLRTERHWTEAAAIAAWNTRREESNRAE